MRETVVRHYGNHSHSGRADYAMLAVQLAAEEARIGSIELKERIEKAVFKFGWQYKITTDEARHLLLNTGVRLAA
jgi:hypothetical protein